MTRDTFDMLYAITDPIITNGRRPLNATGLGIQVSYIKS